jgi:hypothetical protein
MQRDRRADGHFCCVFLRFFAQSWRVNGPENLRFQPEISRIHPHFALSFRVFALFSPLIAARTGGNQPKMAVCACHVLAFFVTFRGDFWRLLAT